MPLIAPNTPLIKLSDLEEEQERVSNCTNDDRSILSSRMASSKERILSSRASRKEGKSTPKGELKMKP